MNPWSSFSGLLFLPHSKPGMPGIFDGTRNSSTIVLSWASEVPSLNYGILVATVGRSVVGAEDRQPLGLLVPAAQLWSDGCFGTVRTGWMAQFRAPKRPRFAR